MKYDDASWHYGGEFPEDLPDSAGATHIGMFVSWCMLNGLGGSLHTDDFPELLQQLKCRQITPGQYFIRACDEKFVDEDLDEKGNAFTKAYYASENRRYLDDYSGTFVDFKPTLYHVPDSWDSFDQLAPVIAKRFAVWEAGA